jgi:hypothetical protein
MIANVALDYTEWAPPLRAEAVLADITSYRSMFDRTPSKIVVWVHQWDYLTKQYENLKPKYVVDNVEVDGSGLKATLRPPESSDGGYLWGVKVEVRDPKAHAA